MPAPGSVYCKSHKDEQTPALLPSALSKETLTTLNKEQKKRAEDLERDSIFVIEKILGKKLNQGKVKYKIKWENYEQPTWEPQENIPEIFRNYYDRTGNENIFEPRIKHTKKVGSTIYHLLSWEDGSVYWEKENAFTLEGLNIGTHEETFKCQTRKVTFESITQLISYAGISVRIALFFRATAIAY